MPGPLRNPRPWLRAFWQRAYRENVTGMSAMVAYNLMLAVFPFALLVLGAFAVAHSSFAAELLVVGVPGDRDVDLKRLGAVLAPAEVELFDDWSGDSAPGLVRGYIGPQILAKLGVSGRVEAAVLWREAELDGAAGAARRPRGGAAQRLRRRGRGAD